MDKQINASLTALTKLQIPADLDNWGKNTIFCFPGKPLLILAVTDLMASGSLQENIVEPSFELAATYNRYWQTIVPNNPDHNLATTFLELEADSFWKIICGGKAGQQLGNSMASLRKNCQGARINADIFAMMTDKDSRRQLRETIFKKYFAENTHPALLDVALVNHGAAIYSRALLSGAPMPDIKTDRDEEINRKIAIIGFDSAVVQLYDHRCAICGIKLLTPEGNSAVQATHIVPWHISRNDHPGNGLALCKICGWSFENGLMGISEEHEVIIPTAIRLNGNLPGHLLIFKGKVVAKPKQESLRPAPENLKWHRDNILRK